MSVYTQASYEIVMDGACWYPVILCPFKHTISGVEYYFTNSLTLRPNIDFIELQLERLESDFFLKLARKILGYKYIFLVLGYYTLVQVKIKPVRLLSLNSLLDYDFQWNPTYWKLSEEYANPSEYCFPDLKRWQINFSSF